MDVAQITAALGAVVAALTAITLLIRSIANIASGKNKRERQHNADLLEQRKHSDDRAEEALERADDADTKRRAAIAETDRLRRLLLNNGINPGEEPDLMRTKPAPRKRRKE